MKRIAFALGVVVLSWLVTESHAKSLNLEKITGVPAISFQAFTLDDIRRAMNNPTLTTADVISLKHERKVRIDRLLLELNSVEKWLNTYGRSLREDTSRPPIIGRVELPMQRRSVSIPVLLREFQSISPVGGQPCNGPLVNPPILSWGEIFGDPEVIEISLAKELKGTNEIYGVSGSGHMGVEVTVAGERFTVAAIDNKFYLPQDHPAKDATRYGEAKLTIFDQQFVDKKDCTLTTVCTGQQEKTISKTFASKEWIIAVIEIPPLPPIPVKLKLALDGQAKGLVYGSAAPLSGEVAWEAVLSINARGECFVDLSIVEAGGGASVNLLTGRFGESGTATLRPPLTTVISGAGVLPAKNGTNFDWAHTRAIDISALSGSIYVFLTVEMPGLLSFISKTYSIELYSWAGVPIYSATVTDTIDVCRPTASDSQHVYCSNEMTPVDIGFDEKNCGGCGVSCGPGASCGREPGSLRKLPGVCTGGIGSIQRLPGGQLPLRIPQRRVTSGP